MPVPARGGANRTQLDGWLVLQGARRPRLIERDEQGRFALGSLPAGSDALTFHQERTAAVIEFDAFVIDAGTRLRTFQLLSP